MFNASWIAPNMLGMQIQTNNNSNHIFENYNKLPLIPLKNQFLFSEKPQFKIQQQVHTQQNSLNFFQIFEINQKNKFLLEEIMNTLNQDRQYRQEKKHGYIQTQEDEPQAKPHRKRFISYDNKIQSDRNLDDENNFEQLRKITHKQKNDELKKYSITESIDKRLNTNEINIMDDRRIEFDTKYRNNIKVSNTNRLEINQKIQKKNVNEFKLNFIELKQNDDNNIKQIKKKKYKLKIIGYLVLAAMHLSKKFRKIQKEKDQQRNQINQNYQESQKAIDKFSKRQAIVYEKQYYVYVVEKVIHYFKDQSFIDETKRIQNSSKEYKSDMRKLNVFKFTTLLFKNVEYFTRQNTISDLIRGLLNQRLYEKSMIPVSKFVGQRCHFYNDHHLKIPQEQLVLIALEHYFFDNLIPSLLEILSHLQDDKNDTKQNIKTNPLHLNECHFYVCIFAALIQQKIIQNFQELRMIKNPNGKIVYKTLKVTEQSNLIIKAQIILDNQQIDNKDTKNQLVKGLISSDLLLALEEDKPQWKKFIDQTFSKIIRNFQNILPK